MIDLWEPREPLWNTKDNEYSNKNTRRNLIREITTAFKEPGIAIDEEEVTHKLSSLRKYYGGQRRMSELKMTGEGAEEAAEKSRRGSVMTDLPF